MSVDTTPLSDFCFRWVGVKRPGKWARLQVDEIETTWLGGPGNKDGCSSLQRYLSAKEEDGEPVVHDFAIDLDCKEDLDQARRDAIELASFLANGWSLSKEEFGVYFSGSKGFHFVIPAEVLGIQPDNQKIRNRVHRRIACNLAEDLNLSSLDLSLYADKHLLTIPGTKHSATNLFKVPLDPYELNFSVEKIKDLAKVPRYFDPLSTEKNTAASFEFEVLYQQLFVEEKEAQNQSRKRLSEEQEKKLKDEPQPTCISSLLDAGPTAREFNFEKMRLLSYLALKGHSRAAALDVCEACIRKGPVADAPRRTKEARSAARTIFGNLNEYAFARCRNCTKPCPIAPDGPVPFPVVSFFDIKIEKVEWGIEQHFTREGLNLVSGLPKVGKSFVVCEAAICLATGLPLFGRFTSQKVDRILLINPEDHPSQITRGRLDAFARYKKVDPSETRKIITVLEPTPLDTEKTRARFRQTIESEGIEIAILDPFIRFAGCKRIRDETETGEILDFLRNLTREFKTTVIFAHHEVKNREAYSQRESLSLGSVNFAASRDSGVYVTRTSRDREPLIATVECSHRHSLGIQYGLRLRSGGTQEEPSFWFETFDVAEEERAQRDVKEGKARLAILDFLRGAKVGFSKNALYNAAKKAKAALSREKVLEIVDEMERRKEIKFEGGKYFKA